MPDSNTPRSGGELLPLRSTTDHDEIELEPARLEPLTPAQEVEAVDLLAVLFAAAARRLAERGALEEAA